MNDKIDLLTQAELQEAHKRCTNNRTDLENSTTCGCFYCTRSFPPSDIKEWTDKGQTAICPLCGIDSVIGDNSGRIDLECLLQMHTHWFGRGVNKRIKI